MLHGSSCLLIYENTPASVAARYCLDLVRCAFFHKLSAFYQHLLRLIKTAVSADTNVSVKPKYQPYL